MVAYKVTTDGRSIYAPASGAVRYALGVTTRRPKGCGPLAVFDTLDHAVAFLVENTYGFPYRAIFECHIRKSQATELWTSDGHTQCLFPKGTILANTVTPLRRV